MLKIISGAQTGVDRAALDIALKHGLACGGWCPEGRLAEDGRIAETYPVTELPGGGYPQRTRQNVLDSDGTVIIYFGKPGGGTKKTYQYCVQENKPCLLLDARQIDSSRAAERILGFYRELPGHRLNFAGPRASGEPRAYAYTRETVEKFLQLYAKPDDHYCNAAKEGKCLNS